MRRRRSYPRPSPSPFLPRAEERPFFFWLADFPIGWRPHDCPADRLARAARGWRADRRSLWAHVAEAWRRDYQPCPGRGDDLLKTWRAALTLWRRERQGVAA